MARSIFSVFAISSILSSSFALPLEAREARPQFSIVNVDGSSNPTYTAPPQIVTQTIASILISTVDVNRDTATETIYVTETPMPEPIPTLKPIISYTSSFSSTTSASSSSTNSTTSSTSSSSATRKPCNCGHKGDDGAPFRTHYPIPTGSQGTGVPQPLRPSGDSALQPSGMTAPFPTLAPNDGPYWYNETQVPNYRKRVIING